MRKIEGKWVKIVIIDTFGNFVHVRKLNFDVSIIEKNGLLSTKNIKYTNFTSYSYICRVSYLRIRHNYKFQGGFRSSSVYEPVIILL